MTMIDFTSMGPLEIIILAFAIITIFIILLIVILKARKPKSKPLEPTQILLAFGEENIEDITFKRNKINIKVIDVKKTDMERLKAEGAVGINIVGDVIKFYIEEDNEKLYQSLKDAIERNK